MKFVIATFAYLKKSFFIIALIMLVPAMVYGLYVKPLWEVTFISQLVQNPAPGIGETSKILFQDAFLKVYPYVIIYFVFVLFASFALSVVERHLRTGKLSFKSPAMMINNSLFSVILVFFLILMITLLLRLILFGSLSLTQTICSALGAGNIIIFVISAVLAVIFFSLHCLFLVPVFLWAPIMNVYGYSLRDAIVYSFNIIQKNVTALLLAILFPQVIVIILQLIINFLPLLGFVKIIFAIIFYLFLFVYFIAFIMTALFKLNKLERRDKRRLY